MVKLNENQVIYCKTLEECIKILSIFKDRKCSEEDFYKYKNICFGIIGKTSCLFCSKKKLKKDGYEIIKAIDFILNNENEIRFDKIEKHLGLNTEVTVSKMESVEVNNIKNELTELPEKWCVKANNEKEANSIYEWFKKHKQTPWGLGPVEILNYSKKGFICFPAVGVIGGSHKIFYQFEKSDYTEITFDEFKKWVLKEDENNTIGVSYTTLSIREVQVKVTSQEEVNECAEIAKACGEKIGDITRTDFFSYFRKDAVSNQFKSLDKSLYLKKISIQEYRERFGKSDISKTETTEIDWSKAGQLVCCEIPKTLLMTTGFQKPETFEAILLQNSDKFNAGMVNDHWRKECFKLCTEPITLKNE